MTSNGARPETMQTIERAVEARAQEKLDETRQHVRLAEKALEEIAGTVLLGDSVQAELRDALQAAKALNERLQQIKTRIADRFRREGKEKDEVTTNVDTEQAERVAAAKGN